jgi:cytochrome c556
MSEPISHKNLRLTAIALGVAAVVAVALLVTTVTRSQPGGDPLPTFQTTASIQDIMASIVDPAADALWDSVSEEWDKDGLRENKPVTDEDWKAVRDHAVVLQESADLLLFPGRRAAAPGKVLEDADVEGIYDAADVEAAIAKDRAGYEAFSVALHETARELVVAAEAKDVHALQTLGEQLDAVCEACHLQYWYPGAQRAPVVALPESEPVSALLRLMREKVIPASTTVFETTEETPIDAAKWQQAQGAAEVLTASAPELAEAPQGLAPIPWREVALRYGEAVSQVRHAIAKRDAEALESANNTLYQTCETCHQHYPVQNRS